MSIAEAYILQWDNDQKFDIVHLIIESFQVQPLLLKNNTNMVERIFILICSVLANIPDKVPEVWFQLPTNLKEDDL